LLILVPVSAYIAEIELLNAGSEAFLSLIPEQRSIVNELMSEGSIISYAVSGDRKKMWCIFEADSELEVHRIIDKFPLNAFMDSTIHKLLFHNMHATIMGSISLN